MCKAQPQTISQPSRSQALLGCCRGLGKPKAQAHEAGSLELWPEPRLIKFHWFLKIEQVLAKGMTVIQWWGVHHSIFTSFLEFTITYYYAQEYGHHYPTWVSLAHDYLAVMASSMLSEQAFLAAGITISKCCNWLKGDIVEALQCLQCLYHQDLIFCEIITCSEEDVLDEVLPKISDSLDEFVWDQTCTPWWWGPWLVLDLLDHVPVLMPQWNWDLQEAFLYLYTLKLFSEKGNISVVVICVNMIPQQIVVHVFWL